jgi:hypothetical protein
MFPTLTGAATDAVDQALDRLRIRLLSTAAAAQPAPGPHPQGSAAPLPADRCRASGAPTRERHPRGTDTAA